MENLSAPRRLLKISLMHIFPVLQLEFWIVDPDVDGFSGNVFAVLIHYFQVADAGMGMVVQLLDHCGC